MIARQKGNKIVFKDSDTDKNFTDIINRYKDMPPTFAPLARFPEEYGDYPGF